MALVKQISNILNDAVKDALGKNANLANLDSSDIVSMGKAISAYDAFEPFYKSLTNRLVKTVYFVRTYSSNTRHILRDEHEYGAFIQKVYYELPEAKNNATWSIPASDGKYRQSSPFDVEDTVAVSSITFGGKGTWTIELIRPLEQIKTAFLDEASMMAFIDGLYVTVENAFKLQEERLVALAANTAIADALNSTNKAQARNLLAEYNSKHSSSLTAAAALEDASFLKFASMEIKRVIDNMSVMSSVYNKEHYHTFTSSENLVVEMLSHFVSASEMYLQADTFHNDLVGLPNFESVPYWQGSGETFDFAHASAINVTNSDINEGVPTEQSGIICFVHDIENVAAYFGNRRSWEMNNPRSEVMIHGEKADKGFAIDGHANAVVFYIA